MVSLEHIKQFFQSEHYAIVGVSAEKGKFGNFIFSKLSKKGFHLYPVHRTMKDFKGSTCYSDISSLPPEVDAVIINTPSESTPELVREAIEKGIRRIWLQQGSTSGKELFPNDIDDLLIITDECIIMYLDKPGFPHNLHAWIKGRQRNKEAMNAKD